ncbi:hypothetical protein ACFX2I_018645 [Malus domestica]
MFSQEVKNILEEMRDNNLIHNRLLEALVNKAHEGGPADRSRQPPFKNNPLPIVQAETRSVWLKMIDLEKRGVSSSRSDRFDQGTETTSIDMVDVQRMINLAQKNGPKFPKFIHSYPAFVEKFEYPKRFKIQDFSLFAGESSLSSLENVARFIAQCRDINNDFHKL